MKIRALILMISGLGVFAAAGGMAGCSSSSAEPFSVTASNADLYAKVYLPSCAISNSCHKSPTSPNQAGSNLDFSSGAKQARLNMLNKTAVDLPSNENNPPLLVNTATPADSYLIRKLTPGPGASQPDDTGLSCKDGAALPMPPSKTTFGCGDLMPQSNDSWADREAVITAITAWIKAGAPDN